MLDTVIKKLFISPCWKAFDFFYMKTSINKENDQDVLT